VAAVLAHRHGSYGGTSDRVSAQQGDAGEGRRSPRKYFAALKILALSVHFLAMATKVPTTLGSQLRLVILRLGRRLRQQAVSEVTPSQLSALSTVAKHGELTLGELAAIERIAPPSMTRIAARLEDQGWLERRADTSDRRVARVAVSAAGQELLDETRTRRDAFLSNRLQQFTDEERAVLERAVPLLERLASDED
jgi:DNA-binding MarR family transcriptional regulator